MVEAHPLTTSVEAARGTQVVEQDARPELARLRRVWAIGAAPVAAGTVGLVVNVHEPQLALMLALSALAIVLWGERPLQSGAGLAATMALGVVAHGLGSPLATSLPFVVAAATAPTRSWRAAVIHTGVCGAVSLFAVTVIAAWIERPVLGVLAWAASTFALLATSHRVARRSPPQRRLGEGPMAS